MEKNIIKQSDIASKIYIIRGKKVMLDMDLAILYQVENKILKRAVKRHIDRFPKDFMFELTKDEFKYLRCQFGTANWGKIRFNPMVFTEQGVSMLSTVLNSNRAIHVNIQIMRTFTQLRELILSNKDVKDKITELEKKYDKQFQIVFEAIKQLLDPPMPKKEYKIGFIKNQ